MEAVEVRRRIGAKELSPVEVLNAVLDRMERLEPILHAFCWPTPFVPPRRPRESRRSATAWHHQVTEGQAARVEEVAWLNAAAYSLYGSRRGSDEARGAGLYPSDRF